MRRFIAITLLLTATALYSQGRNEPPITRKQADAILQELKEIRVLLEKSLRQQAPSPAAATAPEPPTHGVLKFEGGYILGAKDAPMTMVEFTDYQCPFCRQFHQATFPEIRKKYIDTGKLRFISRDMPLDFHPNAQRAAEAARCAGEQNQYWRLRDVLIANAAKLAAEDITGYAQGIYLDMPVFQTCMQSGRHKAEIDKEAAEAAAIGISATPSFLIGRSTPDGVEGAIVIGAQPIATFDGFITDPQKPTSR